jgi:acyl carrier protein
MSEDLGADSLAVVELLMQLEEEFGVTIPELDLAEVKSTKELLFYLRQMRDRQTPQEPD